MTQKLKQNITEMQNIIKEAEGRVLKHQKNLNRCEIDLEEYGKKIGKDKEGRGLIEVDRENCRMVIKMEKNGGLATF